MKYDIAIIGAGAAGLGAAIKAQEAGASVVIIEREKEAGGILKQCIHDGFGLHHFKERLTGPEYVERFLRKVVEQEIPLLKSTFVSKVIKEKEGFKLTLINKSKGVFKLEAKALLLANGCRERTSKQVGIHGHRPAGVYTAGTAQYFVNIQGELPCKECVILGSGDIGLIMARRLTLEGCHVKAVYEIKPTPSGLTRNVIQCLQDFKIPLHLSKTITKIHGQHRVEGVTVMAVDEELQPVENTEEFIPCDGVILSVGLIPENEIALSLQISLDMRTKGPIVDQNLMTDCHGVFSCGNALHVNDLVDYVTETAQTAATAAIDYIKGMKVGASQRKLVELEYNQEDFLYVVPQKLNLIDPQDRYLYFRSKTEVENKELVIKNGEQEIYRKAYRKLKPPEMERLILKKSWIKNLTEGESLQLLLEEGKRG